MLNIGYIVVDNKKIKVLARTNKTYRQFKLRTTGSDGVHFNDEEAYLTEARGALDALLKGSVITL